MSSDPRVDRLLDVKTVADKLSLSERSIRRLLPEIGFVRVGRSIRVPQSNIKIFLESRSVAAAEGSSRRRDPASENIAMIVDRIIGRNRRRDL